MFLPRLLLLRALNADVIQVLEKLEILERGALQQWSQPVEQVSMDSARLSSEQAGKAATDKSAIHRHSESEFEILCNDIILPLNMTLAAVRHYIWRQNGELVMHYRRKLASAPDA